MNRRILALALLIALAGCAQSGDTDPQDAYKIDPAPYQEEIARVEAILYQSRPSQYGDLEAAAGHILVLYEAVSRDQTELLKRARANRLVFLAQRADMEGAGGGYTIPDLDGVRTDWEKTRAEVFLPADWFHSSTPELAEAQSRPEPAVDPQHAFALGRVVERLERLIDEGRYECDALGEPEYSIERMGVVGRSQVERWNAFHGEWNADLDYAVGFFPPAPGFDGDADFVMAYQSVGFAVGELRLVTMGVGDWPTPFRYQWEQRFDSALAHLEEARARLDMPR